MSDDIFAERTLHIAASSAAVIVRIYVPEPIPDATAPQVWPWACRYELEGLPPLKHFSAARCVASGRDKLDALLHAVVDIRSWLDAVHEETGLEVVWRPMASLGHGFPAQIAEYHGLEFQRHMLGIMLDESIAFGRERYGHTDDRPGSTK